MYPIFAIHLVSVVTLLIPISIITLLVRLILKKSIKKTLLFIAISIYSILPLSVLCVVADPATWCEHEFTFVKETAPSCSEEGSIVYVCSKCDRDKTEKIDKLDHTMQDIKNGSRCTVCGYEEVKENGKTKKETTKKETTKSDHLIETLMSYGFTEDEAKVTRDILVKCGITDIDKATPTSTTATIDDLICFKLDVDKDRHVLFTIDKRELFHVACNGIILYDTAEGGHVANLKDIHIPKTDVSVSVGNKLRDLTEETLDSHLGAGKWYDAFGYAREDDDYMVQCETKLYGRWVKCKVWFTKNGENYNVTGVVIDGKQYK